MATISEALAIAAEHQRAGRLELAEQVCRAVLAVEPDQPNALNLLGVALAALGRRDEAMDALGRALLLKPDYAEALNNLGIVLMDQGRLDEATDAFRRALKLKPDLVDAHINLGVVLKDRGEPAAAVAVLERALQLKPDSAAAYANLGNAWRQQDELVRATVAYQRALELNPDLVEAYMCLGVVLKDLGKLDQAVAGLRRAIQIRPSSAAAHSSLVYLLYFCPGYDSPRIREEHRRWNQQHAAPLAKRAPSHSNDRSPRRRLRIGYVSPCFHDHCQAFFMLPLLESHDHENFEIVCYADVLRPDGITARARSYADVWRNTTGLADEQVAQLIRGDRIDVLVDVTMHMEDNRLLVFARKPAPVQVSWLAYPGTTGLSAIDYRFTDPHLDPPGLHDHDYSEESIRLPDTFWCYDPLTNEPEVNALPAAERGYVTFGYLGNFCKVNAGVLRLWARVLNAVDRSRLVLLASAGPHRREVLDLLQAEGVAPDRVTFIGHQPRADYLKSYHDVDLGLDTLPYNSHTTSLDSYWMGVPVVTLVGQTVVGRAGLSQLTNLGLQELVAETPDQFVSIAATLANDLPRLGQLRATLRGRMRKSPLMDAPRFARNVEAAYRTMWQRWCAE